MADQPLMPIATAVWLIDNTSLTFDQIAEFCVLHPLQVTGIADGDVAAGVRGINPIDNHQLTRDEIAKAEGDNGYRMKLSRPKTLVATPKKKSARYTPVSKRQNRPDAIAWMVRNHPEVADSQISKLLGTTKATIQSIRDRSHWNSANLQPQDPVGLGLCSQIDLDAVVRKAAAKAAKNAPPPDASATLAPVEPAQAAVSAADEEEELSRRTFNADEVFAGLQGDATSSDDDETGPSDEPAVADEER
ncbi:MAG: cell cycle transcriptional regulator TrcR [Pseudomonadota bacterium]